MLQFTLPFPSLFIFRRENSLRLIGIAAALSCGLFLKLISDCDADRGSESKEKNPIKFLQKEEARRKHSSWASFFTTTRVCLISASESHRSIFYYIAFIASSRACLFIHCDWRRAVECGAPGGRDAVIHDVLRLLGLVEMIA